MTDTFEALRKALADRYRLEHELGAGGMAIVYRAHDLKHDRPVAVKVLRDELGAVVGPERFLREIRVTANLHHPNIVQLYDSGTADGQLYYVMPLVEGESLRRKLDRERQLGIDEAIRIAETVADALDYAHRRNVIHRDIKPENILLQDGTPLVADFGIALAISRGAGERLTETGLSLGTPWYMSPEQALGDRELTAASDVYALASTMYEMIAGDPPFTGANLQAVIARVVRDQPTGLRTIRPPVPAQVEATVNRALAKVPADRFDTAGEFARALTDPTVGAPVRVRATLQHRRRAATLGIVGAAVAGVAAVAWLWVSGRPTGSGAAGAIRPVTSFAGWEFQPSWSPDGSMIAYTHIVGGDADIATIPVDGGEPLILTGASPADEVSPAWAPDGSRIAYASDRGNGTNVYWIPPTGGVERKVVETNIPALERMSAWIGALSAGAWSPDSRELVFSRLQGGGEVALWKVDTETLEETQLTNPPPGSEDLNAAWSWDGQRIVFARSEKGQRTLWVMPAGGGRPTPLLEDGGTGGLGGWFPGDARIAFTRARNIWEVDLASGAMRQLTVGATGNNSVPVVARNGAIAYANWDHEVDIYWMQSDAPERPHERLTAFTGSHFAARVSPDGGRVLYSSNQTGSFDLWVLDRTTGQHFPLTDGPADDRLPDWSPDGREVVMLSNRGGAVGLWLVQVETGAVRRLTDHELPWATHLAEGQGGPRWAPDGRAIGYLAPEAGNALWLVAPDGRNRRPTTVRDVLSFSFYQDGSRVVYTRRAPDGSGLVELRATHVGSGEDVLLHAGAIAEIDVSPDGTGLTFIEAASHFTMELYLLPLRAPTSPNGLPRPGGEPRRLTFGNGDWHVHSGGWAPDGNGVVYSRDRDYGDIYVIEPERR